MNSSGTQRRRPTTISARTSRQTVLFGLGVVAGAALVVLLARELLVLFAGLLFAIVLNAVAGWLARHTKLPYWAALALSVLALVSATAAGVFVTARALSTQLPDLRSSITQALDKVRSVIPIPAGGAKGASAGGDLEHMTMRVAAAFGTSIEVAGALVVFFFIGVYGAADPESYARIALACVPRDKRPRLRRVLTRVVSNLERWLLGRLVAMAFVAVTSGVTFWLLHVPLALPLAVLAGVLTFVEYVGAVASAIPPTLLALSQSPTRALWVLLFFTVLHVIEGYVLTPLLTRTTVRLPPASTLACQVLMGALLGPLGLTFATPLMVVGVTAAQELRKDPESDAQA